MHALDLLALHLLALDLLALDLLALDLLALDLLAHPPLKKNLYIHVYIYVYIYMPLPSLMGTHYHSKSLFGSAISRYIALYRAISRYIALYCYRGAISRYIAIGPQYRNILREMRVEQYRPILR